MSLSSCVFRWQEVPLATPPHSRHSMQHVLVSGKWLQTRKMTRALSAPSLQLHTLGQKPGEMWAGPNGSQEETKPLQALCWDVHPLPARINHVVPDNVCRLKVLMAYSWGHWHCLEELCFIFSTEKQSNEREMIMKSSSEGREQVTFRPWEHRNLHPACSKADTAV